MFPLGGTPFSVTKRVCVPSFKNEHFLVLVSILILIPDLILVLALILILVLIGLLMRGTVMAVE